MVNGKAVKVQQWIHSDSCAVQVTVDAVIPDADPSEPCLQPDSLRLLDHLQELADAGKVDELTRYGPVYVRKSA